MTSSPWRRRAPHPWDLEIDLGDGTGWHGAMLVPGQDGLLVGHQPEYLAQVTPTTYEYGAAMPTREATFLFGKLTGGYGLPVQSSAHDRRYHYALGVDCSIGGRPRLGPQVTDHPITAPATGTVVRQFLSGPSPTGDQLYCLRGSALYRREAAAWVLIKDWGPGANYPLQAVVFQGTTGPRRLLIATEAGELWSYDGAGGIAGPAAFTGGEMASYIAVVGDECYIARGNVVRVATADPMVVAPPSFGGPIRVGQAGENVTYLTAVDDVLFISKTDGLFTLNADGSDNDLTPELRSRASPTYGANAVAWRDALWVPYGDTLFTLRRDGSLTPIGPERIVDNTSPVRGTPVSASPHADWFLYLGLFNPVTGDSHLLKYGTWEEGDAASGWQFADAWHGSLASFSGRQVSRLDVSYLTYITGRPTLWIGFVDGMVSSVVLPARTPDPAQDPSCRFQGLGGGQLYAPLHDAGFAADPKAFHGLTAVGSTLTATQTATARWAVDPTGPATGDATLGTFTATGQRLEFPDLTTGAVRDAAVGRQLRLWLTLATTDATKTPVLDGVAIHAAARPNASGITGQPARLRMVWTFTVACRNRAVRRDGVLSRTTADAERARWRSATLAPGHVRIRTPDEVAGGFAVIEITDSLAPDAGRDGYQADLAVRAVQHR